MKNLLKKTGWTDILVSAIFALIGVFMILNTDSATKILSYILGGIFVAIGIIKIANYLISKGKYDFYNYDFIYGTIAIIIGVVTIYYSSFIESMFRIMIGIWIIYSGLIRLSLSVKLHRANVSMWIASLIISILIIVGGIYMIFESGALVLTIGIIMLMYAVMDLIESIIFVKYVDQIVE